MISQFNWITFYFQEDLALWSPILRDNSSTAKKDPLDFHVARFILLQVGNQFCHLLDQEGEALKLHMGDSKLPFKTVL